MAMKVVYTVFDGEVVSENRNGTERDYVPDPLGSTVALLDGSQSQTDTFTYWPYGEVQARTGSTATPFQFVGTLGYYRDSSARTYVRARHYQQGYGRWLTEDPVSRIGFSFAYATDSPTTKRDSDGWLSARPPHITPYGLFAQVPMDVLRCPDCLQPISSHHPPNYLSISCISCAAGLQDDALRAGERLCREFFPDRLAECIHNGPGDAVRHCAWSCLMARRCGHPCARYIGDAHEAPGLGPIYAGGDPSHPNEPCMDLYNNAMGRSLAQNKKYSCENICRGAARKGMLVIIRPMPGFPSASVDCSKWPRPKNVDWEDYSTCPGYGDA